MICALCLTNQQSEQQWLFAGGGLRAGEGRTDEQLGADETAITEEAAFLEDLDAYSLDLVELIMELEDQFDVKISDEDAPRIPTVGQAVDYVTSHQ